MMIRSACGVTLLSLLMFSVVAEAKPPAQSDKAKTETSCTDRVDNDGDGLHDCGDTDCASHEACKADGDPENSDKRCSDWIDNDGDGHIDCNDKDCEENSITVCGGSWSGPLEGTGVNTQKNKGGGGSDDLPEIGKGKTIEDYIGKGDDANGERNDVLCSDGVDNDNDGKTDCADFGCRFDPSINVCRGNPGMRFSIVANVAFNYDIQDEKPDTRFSKLQLRSFGPMPFIQNSFYLISMRAEKTPRLTFAMFQIPLGNGHFLNINSGGGGLSNATVLSSAKQLLLDAPYYMSSAFEQGNGAAAEVYGPLFSGVRYRAYVAGGSGRFAGNIGGRYFSYDNDNYTWSVGGQLGLNLVGQYSRWDSQFLYTTVPTTLAIQTGAKYDVRAQERYMAFNTLAIFRWKRLALAAENYTKREFNFKSWQTAYNVRAGFLLLPRRLLLGADFGQYLPGEMEEPPELLETDLKRQLGETQWRVALHWYFWRNVGVATLMYSDKKVKSADDDGEEVHDRSARLVVQYRF